MSFGVLGWVVALVSDLFSVCSTLAKVPGGFRKLRDALPEPPFVGFAGVYMVDSEGTRWEKMWVQSVSARAYVHDVSCEPCISSPLPPKKFLKVAKASELKSLPPEMRSLSKRKVRDGAFVFKSQYFTPNEPVEFWVSCPLWIEQVELAVTMSVGRLVYKRHTFRVPLDVPDPGGPGGVEPVHLPW